MNNFRLLFVFLLLSICHFSYAQNTPSNDTLVLEIKGVPANPRFSFTHKTTPITAAFANSRGAGKLFLQVKTSIKPISFIWQRNKPTIQADEPVRVTVDSTTVELKVDFAGKDSAVYSLELFSSKDSSFKTFETIRFFLSEGGSTPVATDRVKETGATPFIDSAMMASVSANGACQSCNLKAVIKEKRDTKYSTDYFILFDRSHRTDAFTICKHIFEDTTVNEMNGKALTGKARNYLIEKYRKVRPAFFAPKVGSQVSFEVTNFSLLETLSIVTDSGDLFLNNSNFQSVLTSRFNATILNIGTSTQPKDSSGKEKGTSAQSGTKENDTSRLIRLYGELATYVRTFSGSSCTINEHKINSLTILARIKDAFRLAGPLALVQQQLAAKFKDTPYQQTANDIVVILTALDALKPLVYATPRLANRDYINIKVVNGENRVIANQNIRTSFGLKIDFSSGLFLTGLRDFNYLFRDTTIQYKRTDTSTTLTDTSGRIIIEEKSNLLNLGFGFLAHVYPRISSNYNIGLATGFMATTNLDLNIMLGGSVLFQSLFGANTRVALTGGVAWGKVSRLSNSMYEGLHIVNGKPVFYPTSINAPSVVKVWDKSWFLGFTYNF